MAKAASEKADRWGRRLGLGLALALGLQMAAASARADDVASELESLREQTRELRARLEAQQRQLEALEGRPASLKDLAARAGTGAGESTGERQGAIGTEPMVPETPPEVVALADRGGMLTPRGVLAIEPQVELMSTSIRRFEVSGADLAESIIIGRIDATAADRQAMTSSLGARFGVAERVEASLKVPYMWRGDRLDARAIREGSREGTSRGSRGQGLGDVEMGLHYQLPHRSARWPFFVGNLSIKSNTGSSPYRVPRNGQGLESELATGSGYWSFEPSLTVILPTDPAVLYGSLSYTLSPRTRIGESYSQTTRDPDGTTRTSTVRLEDVDPGDQIGLSFGTGLALNEKVSLNLGYSHRYVFATHTRINGEVFTLQPQHVGELQLGLSYAVSARSSAQLTLSIGVTPSAPNVQLSARMPFSWALLD